MVSKEIYSNRYGNVGVRPWPERMEFDAYMGSRLGAQLVLRRNVRNSLFGGENIDFTIWNLPDRGIVVQRTTDMSAHQECFYRTSLTLIGTDVDDLQRELLQEIEKHTPQKKLSA